MVRSSALALIAITFTLAAIGCGSSSGAGGTGGGPIDATGTWSGSYTFGSGSKGSFTAKVVHSGSTVSGTISIPRADMSDAALTGSVKGNALTFGDIAGTTSFTGTVGEDDTAQGTYSIIYGGTTYAGTWTGICIRNLILQKTITIPQGVGGSYHGLAWDGSAFWIAGGQQLARVTVDGIVDKLYMYNMLQFPLHDFDSLGWDGTLLWAVEDPTQDDYTRAQFCAINPSTGEISKTIPSPPDGTSPSVGGSIGLGLAWDGTSLWSLRYSSNDDQLIYRVNRDTGASLGTIPTPSEGVYGAASMPGGFGAVGADLFYVERMGYLYKLRSSDGHLMRRYTYDGWKGGLDLGGIAWDGTLLWVRDILSDQLYGFTVP